MVTARHGLPDRTTWRFKYGHLAVVTATTLAHGGGGLPGIGARRLRSVRHHRWDKPADARRIKSQPLIPKAKRAKEEAWLLDAGQRDPATEGEAAQLRPCFLCWEREF